MQTKPKEAIKSTNTTNAQPNYPTKQKNNMTNSAFFQAALCHAHQLDIQEAASAQQLGTPEDCAATQWDDEQLQNISHGADDAELPRVVKDELQGEQAEQHECLPPTKKARAADCEAVESFSMDMCVLSLFVCCFLCFPSYSFIHLMLRFQMKVHFRGNLRTLLSSETFYLRLAVLLATCF